MVWILYIDSCHVMMVSTTTAWRMDGGDDRQLRSIS